MQTSIATVKAIGQTSVGGVSLQFSTANGDFWAYPEKGLNTMPITVGNVLQIEWFKKPSADGKKNFTILKSFKPASPSQAASTEESNPSLSAPPVYVKPAQQTGIEGVSEPTLRFISNIVGNAIAAGLIKEPEELKTWTLKALTASKSLSDPSN